MFLMFRANDFRRESQTGALTPWEPFLGFRCPGCGTFLQRGSPPPPPWRLQPGHRFLRGFHGEQRRQVPSLATRSSPRAVFQVLGIGGVVAPPTHERLSLPGRFSWEGADCEAEASASGGAIEARVSRRPPPSRSRLSTMPSEASCPQRKGAPCRDGGRPIQLFAEASWREEQPAGRCG